MNKPIRLAVSNALGTFLEYFDYTLYGFSAPLIAHLFFPTKDRLSSLLLAWGIFFISFLVMPFGAVFLGHLGDRLGRRSVLTACILMMGIPTCAISFLPTYQQIGILAPILLTLCRILQGFAISGEFAGCSVYLYETARRYKGFLASITTCASGFGMLIASLWIFLFTHFQLIEHLVTSHYWRLPFVVAGLSIAVIGFYLRRSLLETPSFVEFLTLQKNLNRLYSQSLKMSLYPFW
jgi:MHS family proline/betaine transporter-like MFS transporter